MRVSGPDDMTVGIFGGTFDPPHLGHLRAALELQEALGLTEMRLVPCRQPPHRAAPAASPQDRLAMLELAAGETPGFTIDARELRRPGPSYTVDTLASLRGELRDTPLCLMIGSDAFARFDTWHRWREILTLAHLVVVNRPGAEGALSGDVAALRRERRASGSAALHERPAGLILDQAVTPLDISATRIRALVAQGRSARYLLPDAVERYIGTHGLYRGPAVYSVDGSPDEAQRNPG